MNKDFNPNRGKSESGNYIDKLNHWLNIQIAIDECAIVVSTGEANSNERKKYLACMEQLYSWWKSYIEKYNLKKNSENIQTLIIEIRDLENSIGQKELESYDEDNDEEDLLELKKEMLVLINQSISKLKELDILIKNAGFNLGFDGLKINKIMSEKEQRDRSVRGSKAE